MWYGRPTQWSEKYKLISNRIHDFYQLVKTNGDLFSYDESVINFRMNPNNHSFIKYNKLISALPINWLNETCISSTMPNFNEFKEKMLTQIELLSTSNKTAYAFLGEKFKDILSKEQIKWCESLQISSNFINWKAIYENNYFSTTETKLRSFQIRLDLRSIVTNIHSIFLFDRYGRLNLNKITGQYCTT